MRRRYFLALVVPFLALPFSVRWIVPSVGDSIARSLRVFSPPPSAPSIGARAADAGLGVVRSDDPSDADDLGDVPSTRAPIVRARRASTNDAGARDAGARGSLFVPAAVTARALPLAGKTVRATNVVLDDGTRGVELRGVRALHVGFDEGDVLIAIEGQPTPTQDDAMSAVTAALAGHAAQIHGTLRRRGRFIDVTVEVPLP